jgi:hypothetical protein
MVFKTKGTLSDTFQRRIIFAISNTNPSVILVPNQKDGSNDVKTINVRFPVVEIISSPCIRSSYRSQYIYIQSYVSHVKMYLVNRLDVTEV